MTNARIKRPAYQWYPSDADGDEVFRLMTYEQQGIYRALLDRQWVEGSIPADPTVLAGLLPKITPDRFKAIWPLISAKFRPRGESRLVNDRLELQRKKLNKFVRSQTTNSRKAATARTLRAKKSSPMDDPSIDPWVTSSSSTSSSSSTENTETARVRTPDRSPTRTTALTSAQSSHRNHAQCGVVCLPAALFDDFLRRSRQQADPDGYVRAWFHTWDDRYQSGDRKAYEIGQDAFDFWRARWEESHPTMNISPTHTGPSASEILAQRKARG